jgi:hypothetical protein
MMHLPSIRQGSWKAKSERNDHELVLDCYLRRYRALPFAAFTPVYHFAHSVHFHPSYMI